jgi:diamine N-acetyltransferase
LPNSSVHITKAEEKDIKPISDLAKIIWNQHYPEIITREQIDYMLNKMYSAESLKEQMEKQHHEFFIISRDEKEIGFVSVSKSDGNGSYFLHKFYILQDKAATGVGTEAFHKLLKQLHPTEIKLTVNRQNYRSINFYFKNGFKIERVADFDIGNGFVMNDFVMVWKTDEK